MKDKPELIVIGLDGAVPSYIIKMAGEGKLPAFKKLIERGCWFSDCRPPFPTITPTCWASLSTGATPATHGATCQDIHLPGKPLDEVVSAYNSFNIHAERFWEAAQRSGKKSLIIQMPTSGPARSDGIFQVAGASCSAVNFCPWDKPTVPSEHDISPVYLIPPQLFTSGEESDRNIQWLYKSPASGQWQPDEHRAVNCIGTTKDGIAVLKADTASTNNAVRPFYWYAKVESGKVRLSDTLEKIDTGIVIHDGQWSDVIIRKLESANGPYSYRFRAKLFYADGQKGKLKIFFTQAGDAGQYITPSEFAEEILAIPGVFPNCGHHSYFGNGQLDNITFLEAEAMNFDWQWEVMRKTWENHDIDITVVYAVYLDSLNHRYGSIREGLVPVNDNVFSSVVSFYEDAYKLADDFIGKVLNYVKEDTTIVLVSDHGCVGNDSIINPFKVLEQGGLLVYDSLQGTEERKVDWSKTQAYPVGSCHIYVNLKGRDPQGIVDKADYDKVVNKIIKVLQNGFRDTDKEICSLAFALRREEAGMAGQGGKFAGDVVYGICGSSIGGYYGGVHACQIPTARTRTGDIRSLLLIAGPAFKEGVTINRAVNLYDAAPTICYALGYPQPREVEGSVVFQAIK